jgi:hypothetical protein
MAYFVTRDSLPFLGGQSVGKKAMKLTVVTLDDKSLSGNWEPAVIRPPRSEFNRYGPCLR